MAGRHQELFQWEQQEEEIPQNGMIGGFIPVYEKKKRNRNWEQQHNHTRVTYRGVPQHLVETIKEVAETLQVNTGDVARAFLEFGLNCLEEEEIQLNPKPKAQRMTLFPKEGKAIGWKDQKSWNTGKTKLNLSNKAMRQTDDEHWRNLVSYRGIPQSMHENIKQQADELSIPQGELVTVLFQYAVHAYELGRLSLNPTAPQSAQLETKWGIV